MATLSGWRALVALGAVLALAACHPQEAAATAPSAPAVQASAAANPFAAAARGAAPAVASAASSSSTQPAAASNDPFRDFLDKQKNNPQGKTP